MGNLAITLENIAKEIERHSIKRESHLRATHGRFNLFTVLLQEHDEIRLHTRYLTHLLDFEGTHDCGSFFLDMFLETVGLTPKKEEFGKCLRVVREHCTNGSGNIDIYIEFEKAVIVIENKIWAGDQDRQLERYYEYAQSKEKTAYLFYLSLYGWNPSDDSAGKRLKKAETISELGKGNYCCISYREHILKWLEKCCQQTYSFVNINQALQQYRNVINNLLGNTLETQDMEEIKKMLKEKFEIMQLDQLQSAIISIKQDRVDDVQAMCEKILGRRADAVEQWNNCDITAFRFHNDSWKQESGYTALTLLMHLNGNYTLKAYDIQDGKVRNLINQLYPEKMSQWEPESNFFHNNFFENTDLVMLVNELRNIIEKLNPN